LQPEKTQGAIAQLVEQRTENPCVRGSTPRGTTILNLIIFIINVIRFFYAQFFPYFPRDDTYSCYRQPFNLILKPQKSIIE
jgi:hypothetical protein